MLKSLYTSITVDYLIKLIENKCAFKIIESEQSCNVFRENISWTQIKHIKYQQLLRSTNPYGNIL